ncbi:hypothetical protein [Brevibacillus dissolubilis]|uniref:hypothetical protein n=1 Tax=Brevibacillus dissolubilis TaxID=1844116 RepID=UPI001117A4E0|nr:hypothetical protein [Brevibacillus dissolubilis]
MKSPNKVFTLLLILMGTVLVAGCMYGHLTGIIGSVAGCIYLLLMFILLLVSFLGEGLAPKVMQFLGRKS